MNLSKITPAIIAIIILSLSLSSAVSDEEKAEFEKTHWQLDLELDTPELTTNAIMWAIFDEDPIPMYKQRLEKLKDIYSKALEIEENEAQLYYIKEAQMHASWNFGFAKILGDKVYLLTTVLDHGFSSNSSGGKKWIVSKYVFIDGKQFCWVIPIEAEMGKTIKVVFSKDNLYDVSEIYNEVMEE